MLLNHLSRKICKMAKIIDKNTHESLSSHEEYSAGNDRPADSTSFYIDDITWNDLSMENVYGKIDTAQSSVGSEYLKRVLRTLLYDEDELKKRSERADYFNSREEIRKKYSDVFKNLGKTKKLSLYDYIFRFNEVKTSGNAVHYLLALLLLISVALIFVNPVIGILAIVVMFAVNIGTYFKYKASVEGYFMCFKYIVRMISAAGSIIKLAGRDTAVPAAMAELTAKLDEYAQELAPLKRGSWLLTNSVSGSLVDVVMDYVRMLFHVDIIRFNSMRRLAEEKSGTIDALFCSLGEIETDICIARYRKSLNADGKETLNVWCRPDFIYSEKRCRRLKAGNMYHPLIANAVKNDFYTERSVLLTGSNASGKSTFLKQTAINQVLSQTIFTCLAESFKTGFYRVFSSMALSDNILEGESYFIVEIKSIKRIVDAVSDEESVPVMCFIDEVLRGTNTKERIAASSQILKSISSSDALCFAATHDIELTQLLAADMDNYHFEEFVNGNDVEFDYLIKTGPAMTRNAIRLMKAFGFPQEITDAAFELARQ